MIGGAKPLIILKTSTINTCKLLWCVVISLLSCSRKLQTLRLGTLVRRDFNTDIFLWNLKIFNNNFFTEDLIASACLPNVPFLCLPWKYYAFKGKQKRNTENTWNGRSSHCRCSVKKGVLKNCAKFTGKHLCWSLFFHKVAGLRPAILLKKRLQHRCFPVNFAQFLKTPIL